MEADRKWLPGSGTWVVGCDCGLWVVGCGGQDCREPPCAAIHGLEGERGLLRYLR